MKKFERPFRVGRKQQRAVVDKNGHEVVVFAKGLESMADDYVKFLNSKICEIYIQCGKIIV